MQLTYQHQDTTAGGGAAQRGNGYWIHGFRVRTATGLPSGREDGSSRGPGWSAVRVAIHPNAAANTSPISASMSWPVADENGCT